MANPTGTAVESVVSRQAVEAAIAALRRSPAVECWVLRLDLVNFRGLNTHLGRAAGDALLQVVAQRLRAAVGRGPVVGRTGGDEFAVVWAVAPGTEAQATIAQIRAAIASPWIHEYCDVTPRTYAGFWMGPPDAADPDVVWRSTDRALLQAKERPAHDEQFVNRAPTTPARRFDAVRDVDRAIAQGEIQPHYLPVYGLGTAHNLQHLEALLRWAHPEHGLLTPGMFLAALPADQRERIRRALLEEVCSHAAQWNDCSAVPIPVSVNVGPDELGRGLVLDDVEWVTRRTGVLPTQLRLEVSSRPTGAPLPPGLPDELAALARAGVMLELDDVHIDPEYLTPFATTSVHALKLDGPVLGLPDALPTKNFVRRAHLRGLRVIAEGVENQGHIARARMVGCDSAQGFAFGAPLSAHAATELVAPEPAKQTG